MQGLQKLCGKDVPWRRLVQGQVGRPGMRVDEERIAFWFGHELLVHFFNRTIIVGNNFGGQRFLSFAIVGKVIHFCEVSIGPFFKRQPIIVGNAVKYDGISLHLVLYVFIGLTILAEFAVNSFSLRSRKQVGQRHGYFNGNQIGLPVIAIVQTFL